MGGYCSSSAWLDGKRDSRTYEWTPEWRAVLSEGHVARAAAAAACKRHDPLFGFVGIRLPTGEESGSGLWRRSLCFILTKRVII